MVSFIGKSIASSLSLQMSNSRIFFLLLFFLPVLLPLSIFFHFQFLFFSPVLQFPMSSLVPPPSVPPEFADTLLAKKRGKKIVELEKTIPENEMRENNGKGKYCLPAESFSFSLLVSLARWELTPIFSSIIFKFQTVQTVSLFKVSSD